jgi:uncharacterized protein YbjT (DUF2867 family)
MKIAVVGATGYIGYRLSKKLLEAGHEVRALSRGGAKLDQLVELGAEPFIGSFNEGTPGVDAFFEGAEAAYTMVKSDWSNIHDHYPTVAKRLAEALEYSPVSLIVNISSFGADVDGETGHSKCFYQLEQTLNRLSDRRIVHLRGGWFMENFLSGVDSGVGPILRYGRMPAFFSADLKMPFVATRDMADVAFKEFENPVTAPLTVREVGSEDLTWPEVAAIISREIGRDVEYVPVPRNSAKIREAYVREGFGTADRFDHNMKTYTAMDDGRVKFHTVREPLPTTMAQWVHDTWRAAYDKAVRNPATGPEDFYCWLAKNVDQETSR